MQKTPTRHKHDVYYYFEDPENPQISPGAKMTKNGEIKPRLLHPALHNIPQAVRFPMAGAVNTVGFMLALFFGNTLLKDSLSASTIYSLSSILYLPIGHAVTSLFVFGWPKAYIQNLLMNLPIGMSGTAMGSFCTGLLVSYEFDSKVKSLLRMVKLGGIESDSDDGEIGQAYTNIAVIIITGIWGYFMSVLVNGSKQPAKKHEKEL